MKQALINCPSLANSSLLELEEDIRQFWNSGVRWFHIDIMDGHYVPNLCYPVRLVADLKAKYPQAIADVHMMVTDPAAYIEPLRAAGADYVSFHADSTHFVIRSLRAIREVGMKAGIVLNPSQQVDVIRPYLDWVDLVVLMTVEPGFAGQKFMVESLPRLEELSKLREETGKEFLISIDGGINYPNVHPCVRRGANLFVTGVYTVYRQPDGIPAACQRFEQEMRKGLVE